MSDNSLTLLPGERITVRMASPAPEAALRAALQIRAPANPVAAGPAPSTTLSSRSPSAP